MNDLISRKAAIDAIRDLCGIVSPISDKVLLVDKAEAMKKLMLLPPDVQEVRHGEWIFVDDSEDIICFKCSFCHMPVFLASIFGSPEEARKTNSNKYCPHCGAKMDGGVNDA
jgi:hypothetical protein